MASRVWWVGLVLLAGCGMGAVGAEDGPGDSTADVRHHGSSGSGGGGGACPYVPPDQPAQCHCGASSCSANGCYNGYWCNTSTNRCVSPASVTCSGSSGSSGSTSASSSGSTSGSSGGSTSGGSSSGSSTGSSGGTTGHTGAIRVLFDAAHKQVAGNACWIVDASAPDPQPSNPTSESSWSGGISAWAFDLYSSGRYAITQLPSGTALNYGQGGAGDLAQVDVFISDEPELAFSSAEQSALMSFANRGGGIFLISDHSGAKRCTSCTEAVQVINGFLVSGAGGAFGASVDGNDVGTSGLQGTLTSASWASVIGSGPFGSGRTLAYHAGSTVSASSPAQVVVSSSAGGMMVASQLGSGGRLVLVGDSSPEEDGTSTCSATLHDGWGEADDRALILNATAWLAHEGS